MAGRPVHERAPDRTTPPMEPRVRCGCRGIRSCLVCEEPSDARVERDESGRQRELYQCHRCGRIRKVGGVIADPVAPPLFICAATPTDQTSSSATQVDTDCHSSQSLRASCDELGFSGVTVVKDFVTQEEEEEIVTAIDGQAWAASQSGRRKQDYGPKVNFKQRKLKLGSFNGFPPFSRHLVERMSCLVPELAGFVPVELCNLDYVPERGSAIDPHFDDDWVWGERLVGLSLLSHSLFTFSSSPHRHTSHPHASTPSPCPSRTTLSHLPTPHMPTPSNFTPSHRHTPHTPTVVFVPLPRRSLVVLRGPARYSWQHGICRSHIVSRRLSIVLREFSPEFSPGGPRGAEGKVVSDLAGRFDGSPTNFPL